MIARQFTVLRGYHDEAGEEGSTGGGADDRGDQLPQDAAAAPVVEEKVETQVEETKVDAEEEKRVAEKKEREKHVTIPKERFDQAVGKERAAREAAEKRNRELEEKLAAQATHADVAKLEQERDALEDQLDKALADGTAEDRKRLRKEIRDKDAQILDARVEARSAAATAVAIEQIRYDSVVSDLERDYPFLNPENEDGFDAEVAAEVVELKAAFEATGMGSAAALKKAVKTMKGTLDSKLPKKEEPKAEEKKEKTAEEIAAEKERAAKDKAAKDKAAAEEARRKEEAVRRGHEVSKTQPPAGAGGKADTKAADVEVGKLSDEAFEKLPETELKRLRGD